MLRNNRFRLVTLGRLTLIGTSGEEDASLAKRRLKLAVLAVLAIARRPVPRDTLLDLFWGSQDEARARHSLSNALSSLRRALGQHSITTRESEVSLDPELALDVDALELIAAMEARDWGRAVSIYGGSFLDGVHVADSPKFDQWVFRERRGLEAQYLKAAAAQCATLARARRWDECATLAARWLDTEPLSADAALFLLNGLKVSGTREATARALDEYERLRTRLAREYEVTPDRVVVELAERIREQLATAPIDEALPVVALSPTEPVATPIATGAAVPEASATDSIAADTRLGSTAKTAIQGDLVPADRAVDPAAPLRSSRRRTLVGAVAIMALAVAFAARPLFSGDRLTHDAGAPVIAVLSMQVNGADSTLRWLEDGLPQMIDGKLARVSGVGVVSPERVQAVEARRGRSGSERLDDAGARDLARRVGATLVARGTIGRDGDELVLDLTLHDVSSGQLLRSAVLTRTDALALADEAAARIVDAANINTPGPHYAELETTSLAAYQHYMRAIDAGQAGLWREHRRELDAAIALDSGFISVVRARLSAAISDQDTALSHKLRETMRRYAARATEFDRLHQDATDAYLSGERERSEALARAVVRKYPRDPRAYQLMGNVLSTHGRFDEAERVALQGFALDSLAMEAGSGPCTQCLGFWSIVHLHWVRRGFDGALAWSQRWIRAQSDAPSAWGALAWTYSYMQRHDSALAAMERAISLSGGEAWANGEYARMLLVARRYDAADSAIRSMEISTSSEHREEAFDLRSLLARERGRFRESSAVMGRLSTSFPAASGFADMIRSDNLRLLGDFPAAAHRYDATVHNPADPPFVFPVPSYSARAYCWHHALAADAYSPTGDTIRLRAIADTLEAACSRSFYGRDWRLFHHVRGLVALHGRRYAEAERELSKAVWASVEGWSRTIVELSRAKAAQGRVRDAIGTLRTAYATRLDAMGRYVPISELDFLMADLFAQAGERDSARVYAEYVRRAWRDADPEIERLLVRLPNHERPAEGVEQVVARAPTPARRP